jgi:predicted DNA binding CopG/RHH family protein
MNGLSQEEQELLESVENGEWKSIENLNEHKSRYKGYMKEHLQRSVEVVLSSEDYERLVQLASGSGQSTISLSQEILHKFLQGELVEKVG